ncbi:MAG TPA: nitroreductase family protein [Gemmatimonadales bacterium]|jgi:nitroreductase
MPVLTKDVWEVSEQAFPDTAPIETQLRFLLRYAILAPSPKNSQPWAFSVQGNRVHIIADVRRGQLIADPGRRELYISLGCALENLLVAAEHFGFRHGVSYFPDPGNDELAVTVLFAPGGVPSYARAGATLSAILRRHNDNSVFRNAPVPDELRRRLIACCVEPELRVNLTDDRHFRRWIEALTIQADRVEFANPAFRKELGYWIGQGVFGAPPLLAGLGQFAVSKIDLGETVAEQDHAILESAALLGLITTAGDSHLAHVRAGQLFERLWLTATALGVSIHPMSQTMRRPELRATVAELLPSPGWTPQHLFRVGYSSRKEQHHTPRRPLEDVLV